jgi:hypothetical protein
MLNALLLAAVLAPAPDSGLAVGEAVTPFHPTHVAGPHKGTDACPPCTYGDKPQVQIWTNHEEDDATLAFAKVLDEASKASAKGFRGFIVNVAFCDGCVSKLDKVAAKMAEAKIEGTALAYVRGTNEAINSYKINIVDSEVKNTVLVYSGKKVTAKFVNLKADEAGLAALKTAIKAIN